MGSIAFVGMDVHKATIAVAVAESGRGGEVRQLGIFPNRAEVVAKLAGRLAKDGRELSFCYEAGPCGYGLQRQLEGLGHACMVVAPSLIPSKPGDRVKTDRRDALGLAKLHRAGELTAVWVPDAAHEAMRDLVRARATGRAGARQGASASAGLPAPAWPDLCRPDHLVPGLSAVADDAALRAQAQRQQHGVGVERETGEHRTAPGSQGVQAGFTRRWFPLCADACISGGNSVAASRNSRWAFGAASVQATGRRGP